VSGSHPAALLASLADPGAHPHDASASSGVDWVQTHISHVFLTGERVYKLRKDVDLGFVCFDTRAERNADCLRELALNRRLAPDVYLGIAPIELAADARLRVGAVGEELAPPAQGEVPEHCVVMRRLPAGRDALSLLERGSLRAEQLERLARRVAAFHDEHGLGVPAPFGAAEWCERCTAPVEENIRLLASAPPELVPPGRLARLREQARERASLAAGCFEARRAAGLVVDGHGDLHLQHVWFERDDAEPLVVDCLEFNERLRHIDAAADVAFTAMDLVYRRAAVLAERFLAAYAAERDDFDLYAVVDYFASYRAAVRAKVAALAAADEGIDAAQRERAGESARRHLELALDLLAPPRPGVLVLVGGVVGSGKSTLAGLLAGGAGGAVVSSDRVRKREAGLAATERPRDPARLYAPEAKARVYAGLLERARPLLGSGRVAILDATWSRREERSNARALARELGARCLFVEVRCAREVALARLARRARAGGDASDAGPAYLAESERLFEPFDPAAEGERHVVDTGAEGWGDALGGLFAAVRGR
jgi:aminoglycoside phosphotransferase family enzyme/predicted kinase